MPFVANPILSMSFFQPPPLVVPRVDPGGVALGEAVAGEALAKTGPTPTVLELLGGTTGWCDAVSTPP